MRDDAIGIGKIAFLFSFFLIPSSLLYAFDSAGTIIIPEPDPFSLDAGSAIYCIDLLKNNRYLEREGESGKFTIVEVRTVWSWFIEYDESYPEGYRKRYDIIVNGTPLDWDNSYIEYGGKMVNLKLLFLYRNQYPSENLQYYGDS